MQDAVKNVPGRSSHNKLSLIARKCEVARFIKNLKETLRRSSIQVNVPTHKITKLRKFHGLIIDMALNSESTSL